MQEFTNETATPEEVEGILGGNLRRLLGLAPGAPRVVGGDPVPAT